jgi:hypothetical protein
VAADAQEVAVVFEKFFKTRAGDVGELEFCFLGGAASLAGSENVLFTGAGSLHHLV